MAGPRPPQTPWRLPQAVVSEIDRWLDLILYMALAGAIVAVIWFGALLAADRDRGEPVSATAPHMRAFRIALGVMVITSAGSLARWFFAG